MKPKFNENTSNHNKGHTNNMTKSKNWSMRLMVGISESRRNHETTWTSRLIWWCRHQITVTYHSLNCMRKSRLMMLVISWIECITIVTMRIWVEHINEWDCLFTGGMLSIIFICFLFRKSLCYHEINKQRCNWCNFGIIKINRIKNINAIKLKVIRKSDKFYQ